jgi:hypothetical protein
MQNSTFEMIVLLLKTLDSSAIKVTGHAAGFGRITNSSVHHNVHTCSGMHLTFHLIAAEGSNHGQSS